MFIDALGNGEVREFGKPDKVIETYISKVFFFGDRVIKVYKNQNVFLGNLADPAFRKDFYAEDFSWNHAMSPEIYLRLGGVTISSNSTLLVPFDGADDFYIEMKKVDESNNLANLLDAGKITSDDMGLITDFLVVKLKALTREKKDSLRDLYKIGWSKLLDMNYDDFQSWFEHVEAHIPRSVATEIIDFLRDRTAREPYIATIDPSLLSVAIDSHCHNILMIDGRPSTIDILSPKREWRITDEYLSIVRIAVDAYALGNAALGDSVYRAYSKHRKELPPRTTTLIYEIRNSMIQWPYHHMIGRHDMAEKFKRFTLAKIEKLKKLRS